MIKDILNTEKRKIIALGDSITYGYPYSPEDSWPNLIQKQSDINFVNKGINGDTLEGMLARFNEDVLVNSPELLIVMGGTNDVFENYSLSSMEHYLYTILEKSKLADIKPIIGVPIPTDDVDAENKLCKFREYIYDISKQEHVLIIDFYSKMVDEDGRIKKELDFDGIHPNRKGYLAMAKIAQRVLEQNK